jgi:hypothetical protein
MVGQQILNLQIGVRLLASQPVRVAGFGCSFTVRSDPAWARGGNQLWT